MLELILADQVADLPPPVLASSGQEWQFHIFYCYSSYWQINWKIYPLVVASSARHHGIVYYGMYLAAIVDSSRKDGNLLLFLNI